MAIKNALQRIGWRISEGKSFKPNKNDITAYNELVDYFENFNTLQAKNNVALKRLFLIYSIFRVKRMGIHPEDAFNKQELFSRMKIGEDYLIEELASELNNIVTVRMMEREGVKVEFPGENSKEKDQEMIKKLFSEKDYLKEFLGMYTKDKLEPNIEADVQELIRSTYV